MKKTVLIVLVLCGLIAFGVFAGALIQKSDSTSNPTSGNSATNSSSGTSNSSNSSSKAYTASQVAQHSSRNDCWLIIDNGVYDVTTYLNEHPGGVSQVTPYCGKDATQAYASRGGSGSHSSSADAIKQNYTVGTLAN